MLFITCPDPNSVLIDNVDYIYSLHDSLVFDQEVMNLDVDEVLNYKTIKKLHRAMWHAKADQLSKWLIRKPWSEEKKKTAKKLIIKVINNCETCKGFKQVHGRPRNIGPRAEYPN